VDIEKYKKVKFAHRGLHGPCVAENSISAFLAAVDEGFGIELDIRLSKDGELVVFHDDTLDRVTKFKGKVKERTLEELSKIKLLGTEDTIPVFRDVLKIIGGRVPLLIEIKEETASTNVAKKAIEVLREYEGDFIVESFNPVSLSLFKKEMPEAVRGILSKNFLKEKKYRTPMHFFLECLILNVVCRPDFIAFNHKHYKNSALRIARSFFGCTTFAWTVTSKCDEKLCYEHGFDSVIFEKYLPDKT
jgi:glycerophosphoryl diester phosphodiesterase